MKKATLLFGILTMAISLWAQSPLDHFMEKYAGMDGFTSVSVSADVYDLFASLDVAEDEELARVKEAVIEFNGLEVLTFEDPGTGRALQYYHEALGLLPSGMYKTLVEISAPDEQVRIMAGRSEAAVVNNVLIFVGNTDEFVLVKVDGSFDLEKLGELSKNFDMQKVREKEEKIKGQKTK